MLQCSLGKRRWFKFPYLFVNTIKNEPGVLADISKLIAGASSNIESVSTKILDENFVELNIKTSVKDLDHLDLFVKLKNNKTVTKILRQTS